MNIEDNMKYETKIHKLVSNKRLLYISTIAGIIFAGTLVLGRNMAAYDSIIGNLLFDILMFIIISPVMVCFAAMTIAGYDRIIYVLRNSRMETICHKYTKGDRAFFFTIWIITFLAWLPGLLAAFPCIYDIDGAFQIMWFENGTISAHHPILHTYLLGSLVEFGKSLFGSYDAGLLCYSLFQMFCMSAIFAYISKCICKWLPGALRLLVIISYMILPYHVVLSFTTTKDVLFAGIFALWILKTFECVINMDVFFTNRKKQLQYVGIILLVCALRNTGYYILLFMIPFFLVLCGRYWKNVICIGVAVIFLWNLYIGPVYHMLGVQKGSAAEALSVPMQQLSRVISYSGDTLDERDRRLIEKYIPDYSNYTPRVSDSVKDTFNVDAYEKNRAEFMKLWLEVGMAHPVIYLEAFLSNNIGFWYPSMKYPDAGTYLSYIVYNNTGYEGGWPDIRRTSYLPALSELYEKLTEQGMYHQIPGAFVWYSGGTMFWILVLGVCMCIYRRRYKMFAPFSILIGLWGTLMLSPVVVFRYMYPLIVSVPVILSMSIGGRDESYRRNKKQ